MALLETSSVKVATSVFVCAVSLGNKKQSHFKNTSIVTMISSELLLSQASVINKYKCMWKGL